MLHQYASITEKKIQDALALSKFIRSGFSEPTRQSEPPRELPSMEGCATVPHRRRFSLATVMDGKHDDTRIRTLHPSFQVHGLEDASHKGGQGGERDRCSGIAVISAQMALE